MMLRTHSLDVLVRSRRFLIGMVLWAFAGLAFAQSFSDTLNTAASSRGAGSAPLTHITVSANETVTQIAVLNSIPANHNLKFVIYDATAASFLYISAPQAFAADAAGTFNWKQSTAFAAVTLQPGRDYCIGAIGDQAGQWAFNTSGTFTQGAFSSLPSNCNVSNFAAPANVSGGTARIPLQLWNSPPPPPSIAPVPSLGWMGLLALSLLLGGAGLRSHRARRIAR